MEHCAIRNQVTVYDLTPMNKYRIVGADAAAYLNRLTIRDAAKLKVGRVHYTAWCDEHGKLLDDGTLFRYGETNYLLCCQERHLPWLLDSAIGYDVSISDVTREIAALSLQGPCSCAVLKKAGFAEAANLKPFEMADYPFGAEGKLTISRTGFTGDLGYEVVDDARARTRTLGSAVRSRRALRHPRHRHHGPQHGADRGWLHHHQPRFHLVGAGRAQRPRPIAIRDGARLDGRFRQGPFQRPPRAFWTRRPARHRNGRWSASTSTAMSRPRIL